METKMVIIDTTGNVWRPSMYRCTEVGIDLRGDFHDYYSSTSGLDAINAARAEAAQEMFTVEEIAKAARVTPATVRRWLRKGDLEGTRVGKRWLIRRGELHRYQTQQEADRHPDYRQAVIEALGVSPVRVLLPWHRVSSVVGEVIRNAQWQNNEVTA